MSEKIIQFGRKTVVAMVHIPALPGSPDYDAASGMTKIIASVIADLEALQSGGVDAVMFGNEFDRPYVLKAPPEGLSALASVIGQVKSIIKVPFGVNYLWDPVATVALAVATEASFAREIFTGVYASDRSLFIRVRDGGSSPIKTFETTGTLGSSGGSATAIRTSDD